MENLRARLQGIARIEREEIRKLEHTTFTRLLYRNRNQHRHGLYFRRLEHVRRLLRVSDNHIVWESVRSALGETSNGETKPKAKHLLSLSTMTLDDLKSIEASQDALVTKAIPKAAVRVTLELICREHFLPFAIALIATLARLFVIEQKLLAELRGAVLETKLLLHMDEPTNEPGLVAVHGENDIEDIGEIIEAPTELEKGESAPIDLKQASLASAEESSEALTGNTSRSSVRKHEPRQSPKSPDNDKPSLYELMAQHDARVPTAIPTQIRLATSIPGTILTRASGLLRETRVDLSRPPNWSQEKKTETEGHESKRDLISGNGDEKRDSSRNAHAKKGKEVQDRSANSDDSDDDDEELDDIFEAMEE